VNPSPSSLLLLLPSPASSSSSLLLRPSFSSLLLTHLHRLIINTKHLLRKKRLDLIGKAETEAQDDDCPEKGAKRGIGHAGTDGGDQRLSYRGFGQWLGGRRGGGEGGKGVREEGGRKKVIVGVVHFGGR